MNGPGFGAGPGAAPRLALVTGGAGFIGSNLVRHLLGAAGDVGVVTLDALTYAGNLENLDGVFDHARHWFIKGDVCDGGLVAAALDGRARDARGRAAPAPDVVLHLAAESHVDRSIVGAAPFVRTNVVGTQVMLDATRAAGERAGRPIRFVHVSTDEVYGSLAPGAPPWDESAPLAPNSPYAASKAAADCLALAWHRTYGLDVVVTRCGNNYGPYQFPEKLIPLAITRAMADEPIPVYGDGQQVRDWIHVDDHARAIWAAACRGRAGEVYNVGGGTQRANRDTLGALLAALGKDESLLTPVPDRLAHDRRYALDGRKFTSHTGWTAEVPFERGLAETVAWYRDNAAWWERVRSEAYRMAEEVYLGGGR